MDVKEAVKQARRYISDVFADENIKNVALEEVVFEPTTGEWRITIGFSRPWDDPDDPTAEIRRTIGLSRPHQRTYKVVSINSATGMVVSVTNRDLVNA